MRSVGEHHVALDGRQLVSDLLQKRHERQIDQHHAVFRVIDDPGDLIRKQARIDGVIDRADPHDAVPSLKVPPRIPGQGRDPVAELDPVAVEALRDA